MSVKQYQILQPLSRKSSLTKRGSIMGSKRVIGLKRSVNSIIRKSGRESMLVLDDQQSQQQQQQQNYQVKFEFARYFSRNPRFLIKQSFRLPLLRHPLHQTQTHYHHHHYLLQDPA